MFEGCFQVMFDLLCSLDFYLTVTLKCRMDSKLLCSNFMDVTIHVIPSNGLFWCLLFSLSTPLVVQHSVQCRIILFLHFLILFDPIRLWCQREPPLCGENTASLWQPRWFALPGTEYVIIHTHTHYRILINARMGAFTIQHYTDGLWEQTTHTWVMTHQF